MKGTYGTDNGKACPIANLEQTQGHGECDVEGGCEEESLRMTILTLY